MNGNFRPVPPRLLVLGDCNPDLVMRGDVEPRFGQAEKLVDAAELTVGGSASITACGAARLGVETALIAAVGDDALGRIQLEAVAAAGVDVSNVVVRAGQPTGVSVVLSTGDATRDRAILTSLGAIGSLRAADLAAAPALAAVLGASDPDPADSSVEHLHVGALFLLDELRPDLPGILAAARRAGITVSLDTNWDPAGDWRGAIEPLLPHVDLLLPNLEEARLLSGKEDPEAACRTLGSHVQTVVVKLGAEGAIAVRRDQLERLAAPSVPVVDTTGAGDSFNAGFIAATLDGQPLREALALAVVCGSLAVGASGGTAGQPDLAAARAAASLP
ncbi:MAG: sugar kinase [Thermoleophilales bacterium]|nr:sugar kinase [Thermoleophilales bacterium]